jgi:hypothetical protein
MPDHCWSVTLHPLEVLSEYGVATAVDTTNTDGVQSLRAMTLSVDVVTATWTHPTVKLDTTLGFDQMMGTSTPTPNMPRKTCGLCGKSRQVKSFHKRTLSKDGLQPYCKACRKEDKYGKR